MDTTTLMKKLLAIERAVGVEQNTKVHELVKEAKDCLSALREELERQRPDKSKPGSKVQ
jgi:hypothetical protein